MDQEVFRKVHPTEYLKRFLINDVRPDGRAPSASRKVSMTKGSINTAVGSAMLKLGRTTIVAGVKATLVEPSLAAPDKGVLDIGVELLSIASAGYRAARSDDALVLSEYLRDIISPHIDLTTLCVEEDKLVWHLRLSVYCVDNDGNLEDSVVLASVGALRDVLLPTVSMNEAEDDASENEESTYTSIPLDTKPQQSPFVLASVSRDRTNPLELTPFPLAVTFSLFEGGKALIDPSAEEETVSDSRITLLVKPSGDLRGVLKPGGQNISQDLYQSCLKLAKERVLFLNKMLAET